jgi:uncharacterized membrane protein
MFRRKINPHNSLKFKNRKIYQKDIAQRTIKTNNHMSKLVFILIFLLFVFGIMLLILISVNSYLKIIIGYSLTAFLTFFMAYFGWVLAQVVIDKLTVNNQKNVNGVSYYFRKLRKNG